MLELNRTVLNSFLTDLKADSNRQLIYEIEEQIADYYGVLNDSNDQIRWLEFIIANYTE
jgi:hypothetical protein